MLECKGIQQSYEGTKATCSEEVSMIHVLNYHSTSREASKRGQVAPVQAADLMVI